MAVNGTRQIVAIQLVGDALDLQHLYLDRADHNVQALTAITVAQIARSDLQALSSARPPILQAITVSNLIEASIAREWLLNIGRRSAVQRVAHLFCELAVRFEHQGLGDPQNLVLPMTQEQIGEATALTGVHVNRTIKVLHESKVIARNGRAIALTNWSMLKSIAEFNPDYLHQHQQVIGR
ncbi:MAG: Crp/Fnr family transcriptional regulator [Oxalobacteraceae bacterium]|nr:MAG: Crp/Fnr family transcriptional regulator [Oxalobacteraceae bacterium]